MKNGMNDIHDLFERRKFLKRIWQFFTYGCAALITLLLGPYYKGFLKKNLKLVYGLNKISEEISSTPEVFLYKENNEITVLSRKCPHLGCTIEWDKQNSCFVCPCHGSRFNRNGKYIQGPAKRNLTKIEYKLSQNKIEFEL
jgi:cytochrome b6-f complex iron-sulfur subunit